MKSELEALAWYAGVGIKLEASIRCLDRLLEGSFCGLLTFKRAELKTANCNKTNPTRASILNPLKTSLKFIIREEGL